MDDQSYSVSRFGFFFVKFKTYCYLIFLQTHFLKGRLFKSQLYLPTVFVVCILLCPLNFFLVEGKSFSWQGTFLICHLQEKSLYFFPYAGWEVLTFKPVELLWCRNPLYFRNQVKGIFSVASTKLIPWFWTHLLLCFVYHSSAIQLWYQKFL